jgi:hypothetical protein
MEYDQCGFSAYISIVHGKYDSIEGQSQKHCLVNITSDLSTNLNIINPPDENSVTKTDSEYYGPDHTLTFESNSNQKVYFKFTPNYTSNDKGSLL